MPDEFWLIACVVVAAVVLSACLFSGGAQFMIDFANAISW